MEEDLTSGNTDLEYLKLFGSSGAGVITVGILYKLFQFLKDKCKHSKSKCGVDSGCFECDLEAQEDSVELERQHTEKLNDLRDLLKELNVEIR